MCRSFERIIWKTVCLNNNWLDSTRKSEWFTTPIIRSSTVICGWDRLKYSFYRHVWDNICILNQAHRVYASKKYDNLPNICVKVFKLMQVLKENINITKPFFSNGLLCTQNTMMIYWINFTIFRENVRLICFVFYCSRMAMASVRDRISRPTERMFFKIWFFVSRSSILCV